MNKLLILLALSLITLSGKESLAQDLTKVSGTVVDSTTRELLPFVNITFKGKNIGTTTDINGRFELSSNWASDAIIISAVGYNKKLVYIRLGEKNQVAVELTPSIEELETVEISASKKRYRNKENPAVILVRQAIAHKDENRTPNHQYIQYELYEKEQFDLNNFTADFTERRSLQSFSFIEDYIDTSEFNGKPYMPVLLKEKKSTVYRRRDPRTEREYVHGTRVSGFERSVFGEGISQYLDKINVRVDMYENQIELLDKSFSSPIADNAIGIYKYFITDSAVVDQKKYYELSFVPREPEYIAFTGVMWIADSTGNYALKMIEASVDDRINVNFLKGLRIEQRFVPLDSIGWVLDLDKTVIDIQPAESGMGIYNTKTVSYYDFEVVPSLPDSLFGGMNREIYFDSTARRSEDWWGDTRPATLNKEEAGIYELADSIQKVPTFNTILTLAEFLTTGYLAKSKLDYGPFTSLVSYNDVEGIRNRFGVITNMGFHPNLQLSAYGAYGHRDQRWKTKLTAAYHFDKNLRNFVEVGYKYDMYQPGFQVNWDDLDNVFLSSRRTLADGMLYRREMWGKYVREYVPGLKVSYTIKREELEGNGYAPFTYNGNERGRSETLFNTSFAIDVRLAFNEKYMQGEFKRYPIRTTSPIFNVGYSYSPDWAASDYNWHRLYLSAEKRIKWGIWGFTDTEVEAFRIFGKVPWPFLEIHRGNETFTYDERSYNLMNFLEFASDQAFAIRATHHFNGLITSQMPLIDRLKWRVVCSGKFLIGDISDQNLSTTDPTLLVFPSNMSSLESRYYGEVSAGIENIFSVLRIEAVKRLTYLYHPDVASWWGVDGLALRAMIQFTF